MDLDPDPDPFYLTLGTRSNYMKKVYPPKNDLRSWGTK